MDKPLAANLFAHLPAALRNEQQDTLLDARVMRIERIISHGQCSPPGFWYDQHEHEWVLVLKGAARLALEGEQAPIEMTEGDYLTIPAHKRHRVEWTDPDQPTVWLTVFYT